MDPDEKAAYKSHHNYNLFLNKITFQIFLFLSFLILSLTSALSYLSYSYYFSAFVFPLLSHTLDRKYMFLLCTGILTFITKSSRFRLNENTDVYVLPQMDLDVPVLEDINPQQAEEEENAAAAADGHENEENLLREAEERKEDEEGNEEEEEEEDDDDGGVEEEDGYGCSSGEEGNEVNMNTEEFNKKIEEFIKKMKQELRIEAQQHLITV